MYAKNKAKFVSCFTITDEHVYLIRHVINWEQNSHDRLLGYEKTPDKVYKHNKFTLWPQHFGANLHVIFMPMISLASDINLRWMTFHSEWQKQTHLIDLLLVTPLTRLKIPPAKKEKLISCQFTNITSISWEKGETWMATKNLYQLHQEEVKECFITLLNFSIFIVNY